MFYIKLKDSLRKIGFLYTINAYWKATHTKRSYFKLYKHYNQVSTKKKILCQEDKIFNQTKIFLQKRDFYPKPVVKGNLKIIYVGTDKEQDYCGIIQGLQKYGNVIVFEQKPGIYGQMISKVENMDTAIFNGKRLISIVQDALKTGPVHAVIGQMWASTMDSRSLQVIRDMGISVVNISMDDRHAFRGRRVNGKWTGTSGLIGAIDLACTTAKECCLWYQIEGCPAIYLPEASDPELFKPGDTPKMHDVCFVGANYGIRSEIIKAIERKGIKVQCYGNNWPGGRITIDELPEIFAKSRIILGVGTIGHCKDFYALKMRDFDGPMSGSLYLTHDNQDLYDLYEVGKEIETYRGTEECCKKIEYYLSEPVKAKTIAKAGRDRAVKDHTWEKRFKKLLELIGLIQ